MNNLGQTFIYIWAVAMLVIFISGIIFVVNTIKKKDCKIIKKVFISSIIVAISCFVLYGITSPVTKCKHEYTTKIDQPATCTEDGKKEQYCPLCDFTKRETFKATGHKMETKSKKKPTYDAEGEQIYVCSLCGYEEITKIDMLVKETTTETTTKETTTKPTTTEPTTTKPTTTKPTTTKQAVYSATTKKVVEGYNNSLSNAQKKGKDADSAYNGIRNKLVELNSAAYMNDRTEVEYAAFALFEGDLWETASTDELQDMAQAVLEFIVSKNDDKLSALMKKFKTMNSVKGVIEPTKINIVVNDMDLFVEEMGLRAEAVGGVLAMLNIYDYSWIDADADKMLQFTDNGFTFKWNAVGDYKMDLY